jgi:hypothetical protein
MDACLGFVLSNSKFISAALAILCVVAIGTNCLQFAVVSGCWLGSRSSSNQKRLFSTLHSFSSCDAGGIGAHPPLERV